MTVYEQHKPIRNKIKKYKVASLVFSAIYTLQNVIDRLEIQKWGGYLPWDIFVLVRWAYQYGNPAARRDVRKDEFNDLLKSIANLNDSLEFEGAAPATERRLDRFFKRMLFTQIPFQKKDRELVASFARQLILFQDLGEAEGLNIKFQKLTNTSIKQFLHLYFICWAACLNPAPGMIIRIRRDFFRGAFSDETLNSFFRLTSKAMNEARAYIFDYINNTNIQERRDIGFQLFEHTPFERYPFLHHEDALVPYSIKLTMLSIMNNIYDIFKADDPEFSNKSFGRIFEKYVRANLSFIGCNFLSETEIKEKLPAGTKIADFMVLESDAAIMVETKSTELHPVARIRQDTSDLMFNPETNMVLRSVIQILDTADKARKQGLIAANQELFGLIVTYRDYLTGDPKMFWDDVLSSYVEPELKKRGITERIPPENIFFVSIDDFDYLLAGSYENKSAISAALRVAATNNRDRATARVVLGQHLLSLWRREIRLPILQDSFENFTAELQDIYRPFEQAALQNVTSRI
jgi:hypothetical protein